MGVRRMRKGWLIAVSILLSVALVGAAALASAQLLRAFFSSQALHRAVEAFWRAPDTPAASLFAVGISFL